MTQFTLYPTGQSWISNFKVEKPQNHTIKFSLFTDDCHSQIPDIQIEGWARVNESLRNETTMLYTSTEGENITVTTLEKGQFGIHGNFTLKFTDHDNKTYYTEGIFVIYSICGKGGVVVVKGREWFLNLVMIQRRYLKHFLFDDLLLIFVGKKCHSFSKTLLFFIVIILVYLLPTSYSCLLHQL